jgi:hypothetical protein
MGSVTKEMQCENSHKSRWGSNWRIDFKIAVLLSFTWCNGRFGDDFLLILINVKWWWFLEEAH